MPRKGKNIKRDTTRAYGGRDSSSILTSSFDAPHKSIRTDGPNIGVKIAHLSLSEEARNTEHHHFWKRNLKLRDSSVPFISAGAFTATELINAPQNECKAKGESEEKTTDHGTEICRTKATKDQGNVLNEAHDFRALNVSVGDIPAISAKLGSQAIDGLEGAHTSSQSSHEVAAQGGFFTDLVGSSDLAPQSTARPQIREMPSPIPSDFSDEVILFTGRKGMQSSILHKPRQSQTNLANGSKSKQASPPNRIIDDPIEFDTQIRSSSANPPLHHHHAIGTRLLLLHDSDVPRSLTPKINSTKENKITKRSSSNISIGDAEVVADYIANVRDGDNHHDINLINRDLGGVGEDQWLHGEESTELRHESNDAEIIGEWDSADLGDFDDISTSSESLNHIQQILSKRVRPSGVQYLVVGDGLTTDFARWISLRELVSAGMYEQIGLFEESRLTDDNAVDHSGSSVGGSIHDVLSRTDIQDDLDSMEDERDRMERRSARMTDEQLARLLSKQEELGIASDELVIFDGEDQPEDGSERMQLDGPFGQSSELRSSSNGKLIQQGLTKFPLATAFANVLDQDPYGGFDVMDHERPSLRKKSRERRGAPLYPSDSELGIAMSIAWENDRNKKKVRKQQREELRTQGLLNKKNKLDLKAKYSEGMAMVEVKSEIRDFLVSSVESLSLPPMDKLQRKIVHELANIFKLKSKSIGGGKSRFPVLYKTAGTVQYNDKSLGMIDSMLSGRRYLPRMDKGEKRDKAWANGRGGGAPSPSGTSYRNGEVVGAAAPELGQENKGRAILEKMGWSTGTTLGAPNNTRGIAQPVAQIVKTGKAGLG